MESMASMASMASIARMACLTTTNYKTTVNSAQGVKKQIKIPKLRQQKLRVGREGSILLDDRSTNGKRVFASVGNYRDYPGFEDRSNKKLKVSPL